MRSIHPSSAEKAPQQPASIEALQEKVAKLTAENEQLNKENERLKSIAMKDLLTGALNRRGFLETTSYLFPRGKGGEGKEQEPGRPERRRTAVLILDLDNFKEVNDIYGHPAGDLTLQKAAAFLKDKFRTTDVIGRWGGEEFVVVCRDAGAQGIIDKLYDTDDKRAELNFEAELNGEKTMITMSGGVADLIAGETIEDAIARADGKPKNQKDTTNEGLYKAKGEGKNRILRVPSPPEREETLQRRTA